jgi:hypothetical protein
LGGRTLTHDARWAFVMREIAVQYPARAQPKA